MVGSICDDKVAENLNAKVAQLVECYLAKVNVASSSLVFRSKNQIIMFEFTLKSTGETFVLPTPSGDEPVSIETLPGEGTLTEEQIKRYLDFKKIRNRGYKEYLKWKNKV